MIKKTLLIIASCLLSLSFNLNAQEITSFTLINADTDTDIDTIREGSLYDLADVGNYLNIRANTTGSIGSVRFWLDNIIQGTENVAPYAMYGDNQGDYGGSSLNSGSHTLKATAFSGSGATGDTLHTLRINFTILDNTIPVPHESDTVFEEKNGLLTIEAELLNITDNWTKGSSISGASGGEYIYWTGNEFFNSSSNGHIDVDIKINTPGIYLFEWRVAIAKGSSTTEHNDSWLKVNADDYYGYRSATGSYVHPRPLCQSSSFRCPEGSSTNGFFKLYGGALSNFVWKAHTSDSDGHKIYVKFREAKNYSLTIAARSSYHCIDVMKFKKTANISTGKENIPDNAIAFFPNPAREILNLQNLAEINHFSILTMSGRQMYKETPANNSSTVDISHYSPGMYIIRFESVNGKLFNKKLIVK